MFNWIQLWRVPRTFLFVPDAGNLVCAPVLMTFGRVKRRAIFHKKCLRPGFDYFSFDPSTSFCKTAENAQNTGVSTVQSTAQEYIGCEAKHFPFSFRNAHSVRACPWVSRKRFLQWRPQAAGRTALYLSKIRRSNDASNIG